MDTQEAYEKMRAWLTRPGATRCAVVKEPTDPSFGFGSKVNCKYSLPDGNRCAVGALLSDRTIEVIGGYLGDVDEIVAAFEEAASELKDVDIDFLREAQGLHDYDLWWLETGYDPTGLDGLAKQWGLQVVES